MFDKYFKRCVLEGGQRVTGWKGITGPRSVR